LVLQKRRDHGLGLRDMGPNQEDISHPSSRSFFRGFHRILPSPGDVPALSRREFPDVVLPGIRSRWASLYAYPTGGAHYRYDTWLFVWCHGGRSCLIPTSLRPRSLAAKHAGLVSSYWSEEGGRIYIARHHNRDGRGIHIRTDNRLVAQDPG